MGQSTSKYNQEQTEAVKVDNIKKLFNLDEQNNDFLDSLNLDMNSYFNSNKIPLPHIHQGGVIEENSNNVPTNRFSKHDIFNLINSIEESYQQHGGQNIDSAHVAENNTSDASMLHIKEAVLKELNAQSGAGSLGNTESGCGCDKANCNKQAGGKNKKSKKSRKVIENTSDAALNSTSDVDSDNDNDKNFSIYPYNSSDVSSNASEKNFRMLRRKI